LFALGVNIIEMLTGGLNPIDVRTTDAWFDTASPNAPGSRNNVQTPCISWQRSHHCIYSQDALSSSRGGNHAVLAADPNADVKATLKIQVSFPSGASDQTKRAVTENAKTLNFKNADWE